MGPSPDLGPDRTHGPSRRPALEIPPAPPLPRLHLVKMEAQEVEALCATGEADDPGLVRVQLKSQTRQDHLRLPLGLLGPLAGGPHDDEVSGRGNRTPRL